MLLKKKTLAWDSPNSLIYDRNQTFVGPASKFGACDFRAPGHRSSVQFGYIKNSFQSNFSIVYEITNYSIFSTCISAFLMCAACLRRKIYNNDLMWPKPTGSMWTRLVKTGRWKIGYKLLAYKARAGSSLSPRMTVLGMCVWNI